MKFGLPNIVEVAEENKLVFNIRTLGKKEVSCKCPFCLEDSREGKEKKFYLSLNTEDQLFKCWFCKESGGVFRFIALLKNQHESEVIQSWTKKNQGRVKYKPHPVERLTLSQMRLLGYDRKPHWYEMRKRNRDYYRRVRDFIWQEWRAFMQNELRLAYRELLIGIRYLQYQKAIDRIWEREKEIGASLLESVLKIYSLPQRPTWTEKEDDFLEKVLKKDAHSDFAEQYLYLSYRELIEEIAECIEVQLSDEEVKNLCVIIPDLDLDEELNDEVLFKIQGMFNRKNTQLTGESVC